jgi:hypothetical protein
MPGLPPAAAAEPAAPLAAAPSVPAGGGRVAVFSVAAHEFRTCVRRALP